MKRVILCVCLLAGSLLRAGAQQTSKKPAKAPPARDRGETTAPVRMEHQSAGAAHSLRSFSIADPVVNHFQDRLSGRVQTETLERPVIGMPRMRYGVANGRLLFYNNSAPSSGGNTGSGSVGTGTSVGVMGSSGNTSGVNGKNPYAGPGIYGNRVIGRERPLNLPPSVTEVDD